MRVYRLGWIIFIFVHLILFSQAVFAKDADLVKSEIYSKLKCCECNESFDRCLCPEAKEMKAYVDALLESDISREDIFYKVARKFTLNTILDPRIKKKIEKRLIKEAGKRRPQIVLDSASFDFGKISKKQGKISRVFKFSNQGSSPLIITNIKTSCPCASVSLRVGKEKSPFFGIKGIPLGWKAKIKPGQKAELELMIDFNSPNVGIGKLIRDATVISNDPVYPEVIIRIEAEVSE